MLKKSLITVLMAAISLSGMAQEFKPELFINKGDTLPYRILLPENYSPDKQYPLVLFLHGSGERGSDNKSQLIHGSSLFLREDIRKSFPAIVVFPQCPAQDSWTNVEVSIENNKRVFHFKTAGKPTPTMKLLLALMNQLRLRPDIDKSRLYVGGLSMGAMGTFEILRRKPKLFAAAIAICGGDNPENVRKYAGNLSLWIFHGEEDDTVDVRYSKDIAEKLKELKAEYKLTLYPEVKHLSWNNAFADPELLPWLFSKHK